MMQVIELRQYGTLGRNQHHNYFSHTVVFYHLHQGLDSYILQRCIRNWCMCMSPTRSKCSDIMLSVNCELHGKWSWTTMIKFIYSIVCWCTACNCWYIKCHDRDDISALNITCYLFSAAPEVLKNEGYNRSLDLWSVGVIIYVRWADIIVQYFWPVTDKLLSDKSCVSCSHSIFWQKNHS